MNWSTTGNLSFALGLFTYRTTGGSIVHKRKREAVFGEIWCSGPEPICVSPWPHLSSPRATTSCRLQFLRFTVWRAADQTVTFHRTIIFILEHLPLSFFHVRSARLQKLVELLVFVTFSVVALKRWRALFLDTFSIVLFLSRMRKRMAHFLNQKRSLLNVLYVYLSVSVVHSYNIDLEHPIVFRGPDSSFFGYSVLEHYHDNTRW